jgi:hypothetical protein
MKVFENYALNRFLASLLGGGVVLMALALCLPSAFAAQRGGEKTVAVYIAKDYESIGMVLESKLVSAFIEADGYTAVERTDDFLGQLRKEQRYQQSGNVDDRMICKLGKQFNADLVCAVKISLVGKRKFIVVRLLDVETAKMKANTDIYVSGSLNDENVNNIIVNLGIVPKAALKWVPTQWLIGYRASLTSPYGLSLGVCKRFGGYAQMRGNLWQAAESDLITSVYESGGSKRSFRRSYTAGAMVRVDHWLFLHGGVGYGQYGATYVKGNEYYCPYLVQGVEWEAGATFAIKRFTASVGYSAIGRFEFGEIWVGIGILINN